MASPLFPDYRVPGSIRKSKPYRRLMASLEAQASRLCLLGHPLPEILESEVFARLNLFALGDLSQEAAAVAMIQARPIVTAALERSTVYLYGEAFAQHHFVTVYDEDYHAYALDHVWFPNMLVPFDDYRSMVDYRDSAELPYNKFWGFQETHILYHAMESMPARILTEFGFYQPNCRGEYANFSDQIHQPNLGADYLPFTLRGSQNVTQARIDALVKLGRPR